MNLSTGMPVSADVLGVRVDCVTMNETLERCAHFLDTAGHHQVATLNPEFVMLAQRDARFRTLVREASLVVPDGAGIVWALRRQGITNVERVTGIDLMRELCAQAANSHMSVFLLGAAPGIAARAAEILQRQIPGLVVAGTAVGAPDPDQASALCAQVRQFGRRHSLCCVWLSRPRLLDSVVPGRDRRAPGNGRRRQLRLSLGQSRARAVVDAKDEPGVVLSSCASAVALASAACACILSVESRERETRSRVRASLAPERAATL